MLLASNYSNSVVVTEDTEFIFLVPIIAAAVAADQAFNDGSITNEVVEPLAEHVIEPLVEDVIKPLVEEACGFFLEVLNPLIAEIFEAIGDHIYKAYHLDLLDEVAKRIIVGGAANIIDIVMTTLGEVFNDIKNAFEEVSDWVDIIKEGLDTIGALDFIDKFMKGFSSEDAIIANEAQDEELIMVTDGNGNTGYISSHDQDLIEGSAGLEALANILKGGSIKSKVEGLQSKITSLKDVLNSNTPKDAMNSIMSELEDILKDAKYSFQQFLAMTDGFGSIQFLISAEIEGVAGFVLEAGISIDVEQILYFLSHNFNWDPNFTSLASFHVAYAIDIGVQGGGDVGFSIAYHTSRVTGVRLIQTICHFASPSNGTH